MRWSSWLVAPVALAGTACSSWYRAGPQVRTLDGRTAVEAKATIAGGVEQVVFPLALSGGVMTDDGEDVFALETGGEYLSPAGDGPWAFVAGPRFVGALSGPSGTALGVNAGPFLELEPRSSGTADVLSLELFAGGGLSGEQKNGFVGGACLSFGTLHRGVFTIPSGRVLRSQERVITAAPEPRDDWVDELTLRALPADAAERAGNEWLVAALDEHASIAAFERLCVELAALGAPARLIREAENAAEDERRHARLCFSIASAYLGRPLGPGPLPEIAHPAHSLASVARDSLIDGCFGEGLAAEIARLRTLREHDPVLRSALDTIARDEARHAELGWRTLEWCIESGANEAREAISGALRDLSRRTIERTDEIARRALVRVTRDMRERLAHGLQLGPGKPPPEWVTPFSRL